MSKSKAAIKLLEKWSKEDAYAAGLKEGSRRERRALRRALEPRHGRFEKYANGEIALIQQRVLDWLAARAKGGRKK